MLPSNARNKNQGFTLLETLIIIVIIGILSAIAAPSFLALLNRSKVNNAFSQVQGALQEAQREAIRRSKTCSVTLVTDTTTTPTTYKVTGSCLVTGDRTLPNGVAMANNINGLNIITFGMRGNTSFTPATSGSSTDTAAKIILYQPGISSNMKCIAISNGIGIIRTGNYSGPISPATDITDNGTCNASQ